MIQTWAMLKVKEYFLLQLSVYLKAVGLSIKTFERNVA